MAKRNKADKNSKKETQRAVFEKLSAALSEYKDALKSKKMITGLKKISKAVAAGVVKAAKKQTKIAEGEKKKAAPKKTDPVKSLEPVL